MQVALIYYLERRYAQSEPMARQALDVLRNEPDDDVNRAKAESLFGAVLAAEKKYAEAEPLLLHGYRVQSAGREHIDFPERYHVDLAHKWLVQLYQDWGKPDQASDWKKK